MNVIKPYYEIMTPLDGEEILKHIERCGRVCYKSEHKITDTSHVTFMRNIVNQGHEAVLEHYSISVKFVCDRGVSHEIVRHRMASYCQESTRYCNYSKDDFCGEITVIAPNFLEENSSTWEAWKQIALFEGIALFVFFARFFFASRRKKKERRKTKRTGLFQ